MKKTIDRLVLIVYGLILTLFTLYSFALIDPNITFFNHPLWSRFLEQVLQLGYYHRDTSWIIYLGFVIMLFLFNFYFMKNYTKIHVMRIALMVGAVLLLSYTFISHDFLKYMFDARILTFYHKNPYMFRPIDFSYDPWLRFLQWIEQPFRYGPIFLLIIIVPSFLAMGKFLLSFIFFKIIFVLFYLIAVFILQKMNKRWGIIFATHPLILIDGLVNAHNDIIGVSLMVVGIYFLFQNKSLKARLFLLLSVGIKYLTLPVLFLTINKKSIINKLIFLSLLLIPFALLNSYIGNKFSAEIQTWYFIVILGFLPFYEELVTKFNVLFFGLLISYFPFIRFGVWENFYGISLKHIIIVGFALINLILFILIPKWRKELHVFLSLKGHI